MKLGLGTAQFGMDYGVSNETGRVPFEECGRILETARDAGVRIIDTAPAYGDAESVLGAHGVAEFDVITKTLPGASPADIPTQLGTSLARLGLEGVYALLTHRADDLLGLDGLRRFESMAELRAQGLVSKLGASVYTSGQARTVAEAFDIDIVQLPVNVFDQRTVSDGTLEWLFERDIEVHVRSAFLQGLLLMPPESAPGYFGKWRPVLSEYARWVERQGASPVGAALGFVTGLPQVDTVVVGVSSHEQFVEVLAASEPLDPKRFEAFAQTEVALLDPSQWEVGK